MPRKPVDDEMPRRRRGARAVAVEQERGLLMRLLLHSPKDMIAGLLAATAIGAIVANALFLQAGRHPSPMFRTAAVAVPAQAAANPLPRPRPVEAATPDGSVPLTITVTAGSRMTRESAFSISRESSTGLLPAATRSSTSGEEMRPSGRTVTVADNSGLRQTWMFSVSSGPIL